jgi:hypothetical protein
MDDPVPKGFIRISGKRKPPDNGPFYIQLRCGFVDRRVAYTRDQLVWIHGNHAGDVVAIKRA